MATEARAESGEQSNASGGAFLVPTGMFRRISDVLSVTGLSANGAANAALDAAPPPPALRNGAEQPGSVVGSDASPSQFSSLPAWGAIGASMFWKGRPADKADELIRYFCLPENEIYLDEFNCALRKRVLLQGRMYIFQQHVCFSSFVFGFARKVVIPLQEVVSVRKKTHLRFPNSIKVEKADDAGVVTSYFFTSFLSREDAFQLIISCWDRQDGVRRRPSGITDGDSLLTDHTGLGPIADAQSATQVLNPGEPSGVPLGAPGELRHTPTLTRGGPPQPGSGDESDDDDENPGGADCVWAVVTDGPVPSVHRDSKLVIQAVLEGSCKGLFDVFFSDSSHLLEDFLESKGNRRINLTSWKRDAQLGHVRDMQFVAPIKGAFSNWGVPATQCFQSHRFRHYGGEHLVFESSQTMTDIPYGDCFTVEVRWDVSCVSQQQGMSGPTYSSPDLGTQASRLSSHTGLSPFTTGQGRVGSALDLPGVEQPELPQIKVDITVRVPFSRACLFRKVIESGVQKQIKDTYTDMLEAVRGALLQFERDKAPVQLGSPTGGTSLMQRVSATLNTVASLGPHAGGGMGLGGGPSGGAQGEGLSAPSPGPHHPLHAHTPSGHHHMTPQLQRVISGAHRSKSVHHTLGSSYLHAGGPTGGDVWAGKGGRLAQRVTTRVVGAWQATSAYVGSMAAAVVEESVTPQRAAWGILIALVLLIQVLLLSSTWRAARIATVSLHAPHAPATAAGYGGLPAGEAGAALIAASRELWSQRAAMLQSELTLVESHMRAITDQLALALAASQGTEP